MSRNHEVTKIQRLLNDDGVLREPGWSRKLYQIYDRNDIKAPKFRIKEWDYYLIMSDTFGVALTVSDDGYIGLQSASLLLFGEKPWEHTETILNFFPMGKLKMPSSTDVGDVHYSDKRLNISYIKKEDSRRLVCNFKKFCDGKDFSCDITLSESDMDSLVIATPWKEDKKAFYYNRKINCMRASGKAVFDGKEYIFDPETDFGTLDWGRGVWTYDNTWYWSSGNSIVNGKPFGFNLGYGFGDTTAASENILFYDGKAHKFGAVDVETFPKPDKFMQPWKFVSEDGRFDMTMKPFFDNHSDTNVLNLLRMHTHQLHGIWNGTVTLDDGKKIYLAKGAFVHATDVRKGVTDRF